MSSARVYPKALGPRALLGIALCVFLSSAALGMRFIHTQNAEIAVDEFQHLHGAYLVSQGQTPYVDFFEHHPPLFYYAAAALVPMKSPSFDTIIDARYLALLFHVLTIALTGLWVRATVGRTEGLVVAALLVGNFFLFGWGTKGYLDTYAAPLLVVSAWTLVRYQQRHLTFLSGLSFGLAVLLTQKAAAAGLAPLAVFFDRVRRERHEASGRRAGGLDAAAYLAGGLAAALLLPLLLGGHGVVAFGRDAILLNLHWQARHFPTRELGLLATTEGVVCLIAALGLCVRFRDLWVRRFAVTNHDVPALFLASLGIGILVIPVVWEEYFILLVPFAVAVAGITVVRWWREYFQNDETLVDLGTGAGRRRTAIVLACAVLLTANLIARHVAPRENFLPTEAFLVALVLCVTLAILAAAARRRRSPAEAPVWLALILAFPLVQQMDRISQQTNSAQRVRVNYVLDNTNPTDPIFDGYSGFGLFRPHAYKYWFLHDEVQKMLSAEERGPEIVSALRSKQPPIVIVDSYVKALPEAVLAHISEYYHDTALFEIKQRNPAPGGGITGALDGRVAGSSGGGTEGPPLRYVGY